MRGAYWRRMSERLKTDCSVPYHAQLLSLTKGR